MLFHNKTCYGIGDSCDECPINMVVDQLNPTVTSGSGSSVETKKNWYQQNRIALTAAGSDILSVESWT